MRVLTSKSNRKYADKFMLVVGGGAEIDKAKIRAKKEKKILIAIPTTGAGASQTSHSVIWGKTKSNVKTAIPLTILPPFKVKLSKQARRNTCYDIIGHLIGTLERCTDNEVVEIGCYIGKWLEKYGSGDNHKLSYPLTIERGIPHGEAVGIILKDYLKNLR